MPPGDPASSHGPKPPTLDAHTHSFVTSSSDSAVSQPSTTRHPVLLVVQVVADSRHSIQKGNCWRSSDCTRRPQVGLQLGLEASPTTGQDRAMRHAPCAQAFLHPTHANLHTSTTASDPCDLPQANTAAHRPPTNRLPTPHHLPCRTVPAECLS